jgi:hypothetical protein
VPVTSEPRRRSERPPERGDETPADGTSKPVSRLHSTLDRIPTSWATGVLTLAFLTVTAAFGGLAAAAQPALPELAAGDEHVSEQLALTIERGVLIDEFPEAGVTVEPGQRVLALVVDAENRWTAPLSTGSGQSVAAAIRVGELGDIAPASVARLDDGGMLPWLQPRVPAQLVVTWAVDADDFDDGDDLLLDLRDLTLATGQFVTAGEYWTTPVVAAHATVTLEDVGAGASAEGGEE